MVWLTVGAALFFAVTIPSPARADDKAPPPALKERVLSIERGFEAGPGGQYEITAAPQGSVQIASWKEPRLLIEARIELHAPSDTDLDTLASVVGFVVDPSLLGAKIVTSGPHDRQMMKSVKNFPKELRAMPWRIDYVIWVPKYSSIKLDVFDGETYIEGLEGIITVTSRRGPIRIANLGGSVDVATAEGDIEVRIPNRSWRGGGLSASVGKGSILVRTPGDFSADVSTQAAGGAKVLGEKEQDLGAQWRGRLGRGGAVFNFVSIAGYIVIDQRPDPPATEAPDPESAAETPR